jgi:FMN phosphatase YigB (HAD superfamily)
VPSLAVVSVLVATPQLWCSPLQYRCACVQVSADLDHAKPHTRAYTAAMKIIGANVDEGVRGEQSLFVHDDASTEVTA